MKSWKDFAIGIVLGVAAVAGLVACYFQFGFAPVAVSAAEMPLEKHFANAALDAQANRGRSTPAPVNPTEANLLEGARTYRQACAACHSLPGVGKTDLEKGMYPKPPELLTGKGVTDDPVGRTHWVVQHGIRMTGMPSFEKVFSDEQLWDVSLLLAHAHELPGSVQDLLKTPDEVPVRGDNSQPSAALASR